MTVSRGDVVLVDVDPTEGSEQRGTRPAVIIRLYWRYAHGFKTPLHETRRMTDDSDIAPGFLSSLPNQPITDDIVKQIGESDNPKIRGAMGFPGSTPGVIEGFLLNMEATTFVIVFDPTVEQWRVYDSFASEEMAHEQIVDRASELANEWFADSLSDRIAATDTESDR